MSSLLLSALSCLSVVSAAQIPLGPSSGLQHAIGHSGKELVRSAALQKDIDAQNLLLRAEHLYKIAELGMEEHNHPTRVIGSEGKIPSCCTVRPIVKRKRSSS